MSAISTIDTLAHTSRWSHRHVADKVLLAGGLIVVALVVPAWPGAAMVAAAVVVACIHAGIPLREFAAVVRVPFGFIVAGAWATALTVETGSGWPIGVGDLGGAVALASRSLAGTSAAVLLAMTVPMSELLARARRLGVPAVGCEIAMLMYRMIAVGLARLRWQRLAQESRLGYVGFVRSIHSAAALAVSTFVQSVSHAQRLTIGLGARNFDGTVPVLRDGAAHSRAFLAVTVAVLSAIVGCSFLIGRG